MGLPLLGAEAENPVSAMVTFDVFVRAALTRLQGARGAAWPLVDMIRAADKATAIGEIRLVKKAGGESGDYRSK